VELTEDYVIQSTEVTLREFHDVVGYVPSESSLDLESSADLERPIDWVSWHQAAAYCNQLSRAAHYELCYECGGAGDERSPDVQCSFPAHYDSPYACGGYRLPTESEWEYAARAGTETATYNGDLDPSFLDCESSVLEPIAAYCGNSTQTRAVMQGEPTLWGSYGDGGDGRLYDMLGNVAEWCHDWYDSYPATDSALPWGPVDEVDGQGRVYRGGSFEDNAADIRAARRFHAVPETQSAAIGFRVVRTFHPR
jgi:formylglycine-generating enzyme required for sulfatase activity